MTIGPEKDSGLWPQTSAIPVQRSTNWADKPVHFTAMQKYEFHISIIIIHHLDGLFGPNISTSSQFAC